MGARKNLLAGAGLVMLAALSIVPALAQVRSEPPLSDDAGGLRLDTSGYQLWMPAPEWLDDASRQSGNIRPLVDATYRVGDSGALLEIYPKGEGEALWTELYGARLSVGTNFTLKAYRDAVMSGFARDCRPELTGFFQLGADDGDTLAPLGFVCGGFDPRLQTFGGLGEVMVMSFRKDGDAVALVYQQWRGKAFTPSDPSSWPVPTSVVESRARQLQAEPRLTRAD